MKMKTVLAITGLSLAVMSGSSFASDYPNRPVKLVVPYAAGGITDVSTRMVAQALEKELGQVIVIENRPGGATSVASNHVSQQKPDGYTLYAASLSLPLNKYLQPDVKYDAFKDFQILSGLADSPMVLEVGKGVSANNLTELVEAMKANPGKYTIGASGVGASNHIGAENFLMRTGTDGLIVQYQGGAPVRTALLAGEIDMTLATLNEAQPVLKSGDAKAVAVATMERLDALPDVPTINEAMGWDDFEVVFWTALAAPAGLDPEVAKTIEAAMAKVGSDAQLRQKLQESGVTLNVTSADQTVERMKTADRTFGPIIEKFMKNPQ
ncbi:Bug family tripartite tricarboxylate transporter substrate binding protein [Orrella sp. 11846]|uniref:Bug family tripartite tricarboxylate transporter substrate binding protein n=1 Tax=Orrella sp. 11846 TaxID=3409913 RepID=UPI003B5C4457